MPMPSQAIANQFVDNPGTFLKTNAVQWFGAGYPADQSVIRVALVDGDSVHGYHVIGRRRTSILRRKVDTPHYCIIWARDGQAAWDQVRAQNPPTFNVVWSGFKAGQAVDAILQSHGPGIMLTLTLTGCSVVCSPNSDGTTAAVFSHYNLMNQGAGHTLDKATMEAIAAAAYGNREHRVLTKEQYDAKAKHTGRCEVTVVGHRRNGRWEFWAQYLEDKASGWQIRSVRKII